MNIEKMIEKLKVRLEKELPGILSWKEMSSGRLEQDYYPPEDPRKYKNASVLITLIPSLEKKDIIIPFIQRPNEQGPHAHQISLPGGSFQEDDQTFEITAKRETREEIGLKEEEIQIIGKLSSLYIPVSQFLVHPFVGFVKEMPQFHIDPQEVESLLLFHLSDFLNETNKTKKWITIYNLGQPFRIFVPAFEIHHHIIWGATAMIMNEFLTIYKEIECL